MKSKALAIRNRLFPDWPMLIRLPFGSLWLAWNDTLSTALYLKMPFEQGERKFVENFLRPGMVVLDVGAHHGIYTLLASKKVGPKGLVFSFEPSPRELRRLKLNLIINCCRNVRVEPSAVGSTKGTADLFVCSDQNTGLNSLRPPAIQEQTRKITVPMTTLDDYISQHGIDIDLLKIDVEGGELEVLKGAARTLHSKPPHAIMCEVQDVRTRPWGYRADEICDLLEANDYQLYSVTIDGTLEPFPRKEEHEENLIAIPRKRSISSRIAPVQERSRVGEAYL